LRAIRESPLQAPFAIIVTARIKNFAFQTGIDRGLQCDLIPL